MLFIQQNISIERGFLFLLSKKNDNNLNDLKVHGLIKKLIHLRHICIYFNFYFIRFIKFLK